MELYQSLQNGFMPSVGKKRLGTVMILLALLMIALRVKQLDFVPVFDVFYSSLVFAFGLVLLIWGRGYRFFVKMYVRFNNKGFELKVDEPTFIIDWSEIKNIEFSSEFLVVNLSSQETVNVSLSHLNPNCVDFLKHLFSEVTWERKVPITFV